MTPVGAGCRGVTGPVPQPLSMWSETDPASVRKATRRAPLAARRARATSGDVRCGAVRELAADGASVIERPTARRPTAARRRPTPTRRAWRSSRARRGGGAARGPSSPARRAGELLVGELDVQLVASTSITTMSPSRSAAIGPPRRGLGRDVPDHEPVRRAGEAPVGDQRDRVGEPLADDRAGDVEHLAHPRPAERALVADHDHVARGDRAGLDRREALLLRVEDACRAAVHRPVVPGELHRAALGREVAVEHRDAAARLERRLDRDDDRLPVRLDRLVGDLAHRPAVDRPRVRRGAGRPSSAPARRARRRPPCTCRSRASGPTASCRRRSACAPRCARSRRS